MLTERASAQNASPTPISLEFNDLFRRTNISTLSIHASGQQQIESDAYPESDYQWLVGILKVLTDIVNRNANDNFATLTEADYERLDGMLKELIYIVGEDEKHPLAPLMDFIGVLTTKYAEEHFPKLADLFPELTENTTPNDKKIGERQGDSITDLSKKPITAMAVEAFFFIGNLFLEGSKGEEAISAYDQAIHLHPECVNAYYNRGVVKGTLGQCEAAVVDFGEALLLKPDDAEAYFMRGRAKTALGQVQEAKADYQIALKLLKQGRNESLKIEVDQLLQELDKTE